MTGIPRRRPNTTAGNGGLLDRVDTAIPSLLELSPQRRDQDGVEQELAGR
jgi:hypothetical protein